MKTLLLIFILPFTLCFTVPQENTVQEDHLLKNDKLDRISISGKLGFGRNSKNCKGFGICSFELNAGYEDVFDNSAQVTITMEGDNVMNISVDANSMSPESIFKYFNDKIFAIGETFKTSVKTEEGIVDLLIKAGEYELKKTKFGYIIYILKKKKKKKKK